MLPISRYRDYALLLLGAALLCLAGGGRWDVAAAGWLAPLLLLRFLRARRTPLRLGSIWLATFAAHLFFLWESELATPVLAVSALVGSGVMALPYLVDWLCEPWLRRIGGLLGTLAFPCAWVAGELLLAHGPFGSLTGLGYSQYGNLPLMQVASVTGVAGISFLLAWLASCASWVWEQRAAWPRARAVAIPYAAVVALVLVAGGLRIADLAPAGQTVEVAGIAPSRSLYARQLDALHGLQRSGRATPAEIHDALAPLTASLLERSRREARAGARIVAWSEGAAYTLAADQPGLIRSGQSLAREQGVYLEMTFLTVRHTPVDFLSIVADRSVMVDPSGRVLWTYDKTHPVPGLETFAPGPGAVPVASAAPGRLASVICFDADFPDLMRQVDGAGAGVMLVPSGDWQGIDPMHARHAAFRAVENGYSLVRPTSGGRSLALDYQGQELASSDWFDGDTERLIAAVPVQGVRTVYGAVGDVFAWLCVVGLAALALLAVRQWRRT